MAQPSVLKKVAQAKEISFKGVVAVGVMETGRVQWSPHIFSFHEVSDACTGRLQTRTPIKPLMGILRHLYAHCSEAKGYQYGLNKSYLLPLAR